MNPFVIRTALPFGYLLAYGALLGLGVVGLALVAAGVHRRRPARAAAGVLVAAFAGYVVWVNGSEAESLDLNPNVGAPGQLAGRWTGTGGAALDLSADGTYRCGGGGECAAVGGAGTWERERDFDIALRRTPAGGSVRYRVVRYRGRLRLAHPIDDPDEWDGALPFERVTPPA